LNRFGELKRSVLVLLSVFATSCGSGDVRCVDSIDCKLGLACRDMKCAAVACQSIDDCDSSLEICVPAGYPGKSGDGRVCTARCSVFNLCPEGWECRGGACVVEGLVDSDVVPDDSGTEDASGPVDVMDDGQRDEGRADTGRDEPTEICQNVDGGSDYSGTLDVWSQDVAPGDGIVWQDGSSCVPDCGDRECGHDPVCGTLDCGTCNEGYSCRDGECLESLCLPDCRGYVCGVDPVCGALKCGSCDEGYSCHDGECVQNACEPDCGASKCGPDPICGTLNCGSCADHHTCSGGKCVCIPDCTGFECGFDPVCGTLNCGTCGDHHTCYGGKCVCIPDCTGFECGFDPVCGTLNCGVCQGTDECVSGDCVWRPENHTVNCSSGMCLIPAGSFWMGCNASVDNECQGDEKPYHKVTLRAYRIDRTEVTQGEYKKCVDAGLCTVPFCKWDPSVASNRPVVCVDWAQADAYCTWIGKRLPTEAEWEKAARGTDGRKFPWGNQSATCDYAVMYNGVNGCGSDETWDVCSKSPVGDSPYGLCDMSGNVWEWVSDWYHSDYYQSSPSSNPAGPVSGTSSVVRGGCYYRNYGQVLRASARSSYLPSDHPGTLGFRCASDAQ